MARPNTHHPHHTGRFRGCIACGCTDGRACHTDEGPCWWVGSRLCSGCAPRIIRLVDGFANDIAHRTLNIEVVKDQLVKSFGAAFSRTCGTERIALGGITATCTAGGAGLLRAWVRAAYREIGKAAA